MSERERPKAEPKPPLSAEQEAENAGAWNASREAVADAVRAVVAAPDNSKESIAAANRLIKALRPLV